MKRQTIAEISKEALSIEAVLQTLGAGESVSYEVLTSRSGVTMNTKGKAYMRTAAKRLGLDYTTTRGVGIVLAGATNATDIVINEVVKSHRAIKRGSKKIKRVTISDYFKDVDPLDKTDILAVSSRMESLASISNGNKAIFQKPVVKVLN